MAHYSVDITRIVSAASIAIGAAGLASPSLHAQECTPAQTHKVVAADAAADDVFGISVGISGGVAIIEAGGDDDAGFNSGSAYLVDVATGQQLFKLTPTADPASDPFGSSVAISGDTAIIGKGYDNGGLGFASGAAYLFDVASGQQLFRLTAADAAGGDFLGRSVAISGATAIAGAHLNDDAGNASGSAYLFNVATGQQLFKLSASDGAAGDFFGYSVATNGAAALVGAWQDEDGGLTSGSAYLFDAATGQQLFKLVASDPADSDRFGFSVAISGDIAIVGAPGDESFAGSAYVFDAVTGQQLFKLANPEPASLENFGASVSISSGIAIIGAYGDDGGIGSAYLFDAVTGQQLAKLTGSDAAAGDFFGQSVAVDGDSAIVGAYFDDDAGSDAGSAYLYALNCATAVPGDVDGDGRVNLADVIEVAINWGPCPPPPAECPADLDGSGAVGLEDLILVLINWTG